VGARHLLVLGDSLTFHGPERGELLTDPRLYAHVAAAALSTPDSPVAADIVARVGWTARDVWWAMTRDPLVYSVLLPRADAVLLAVGGMDYLPTVVPTWLREGIRYLRPPVVRRAVRSVYLGVQPLASSVTPWRALPQRLTDSYLDRCAGGVRYFHPGVPVIGIVPPLHRARAYGTRPRGHAAAAEAAVAWGRRSGVRMLDLNPLVNPHLLAGRANPDGMHFGWEAHADIGAGLAETVRTEWTAG
jgi:hypothetical protein